MLRRWNICRFYPFRHHLETGEVLRQSFEFVTVAAEDDGCSGDDHATADKGERSLDGLAFAFFIADHNHICIDLNKLHEFASDDAVEFIKGAVGVLGKVDFRDRPADGIDFYCAHNIPFLSHPKARLTKALERTILELRPHMSIQALANFYDIGWHTIKELEKKQQ